MLKKFFSYYKPHKTAIHHRLFKRHIRSTCSSWRFQWLSNGSSTRYCLPGDWGMIVTTSVLLLFVYLLSTFLQYIVSYLGHKLGINIETDMRQQLFNHVHRQSFRFLRQHKNGTCYEPDYE